MRKRIFQSMMINALVILLASAVLILGVLYSYFGSRLEKELAVKTGYIASGLLMDGKDYLTALNTDGSRITWIAADGTVLYDNQQDASTMENHADREEVREALLGGQGRASRTSATLSQRQLYYAQRLSDGTVLRVSDRQYTVWVLLLQVLQPVCLVIFAALGLAMFLAGRLSRQILAPINALDLHDPEQAQSYEELSPLLRKIRSQNRQIEDQMAELHRRQEEFAAITENMNEGLLAVDERTHILSCNGAAARLLGTAVPEEGVSAFTLERSGSFRAAVEDALSGRRCERVLEKNGRSLQVLASPVDQDGRTVGAVLIFWDATEREQRESLRREFTANVSHELKTPLTAILGTAELLENGMVQPQDTTHFAGNIRKEAQRLIDLVTDIIKLSRLDEMDGGAEKQPVDLYAVAQSVREKLSGAAEQRQVALSLSGQSARVLGVAPILEEMLYNLCDNALVYNRPGGQVSLTVEDTDNGAVVTVTDNGRGIPPEEQERVFERFYRVDKSHSGPGTGLGLSIVKHGAAFHGAAVSLQSREGEGTTVTLRFPSPAQSV